MKKIYIDFEMNMANTKTKKDMLDADIIAIGAIKYDTDTGEIEKFKSLVKPITNLNIFPHIQELTNISQEDISKAPSYETVMRKFKKWLGKIYQIEGIYTFGNLDLMCFNNTDKKSSNKYNHPRFVNNIKNLFVDIKDKYINYGIRCINYVSLKNLLDCANVEFYGDAHDPLYDAYNLFILDKTLENSEETRNILTIKDIVRPPFTVINENLEYIFEEYRINLYGNNSEKIHKDISIEILKTSLIVRVLILGKKIFKDTNKVTKSVPLAKRIIILAALSVGVGTIGWFIGFLFGSTLLLFLFGPILSLTIVILYVYYLIKKLAYLSYIMEGTERIKGGDIHYKLDIIGDDNFSNLAENINNIGEGLDKAIYNQLKSERLKSELITNVSHDLKTPLTSIINYIELIKKEEDIKPEHIKDYVNVLDSKSKRLKVLIEDLFEASKASSGNLELNMEKIDITQLLRQAIGEMEEKLSKANLDLKLRVPEEKTYIMADGKKLYRVLENLLSNISKYSLNNTRVYIDIIEEDDKVKLTMKNISSYELNFDPEEIMERFKRADESRNTEGSGLGIAIARDLVNAQGGRFEIDIDGDLFKSVVEFNLID